MVTRLALHLLFRENLWPLAKLSSNTLLVQRVHGRGAQIHVLAFL